MSDPNLVRSTAPTRSADRRFYALNAVLSCAAVGFIGYILLRPVDPGTTLDLRFLPAVNAVFNALSASCLVAGYVAIRRGSMQVHRMFMVSAFALSALFLVGYLSYHFVHGDTKFGGTGPLRTFYFAILISHIILSLSIVPLSLTSFYFAFTRSFQRHRKLNRVFLPIWLYVSVTGVLIFLLLRLTGSVAS